MAQSFAGLAGHVLNAPQRSDFRSMLRVGHITVAAHQVGHTAYFTTTHSVGLADERERARTRFADLARCQMQVDEGGILRASSPNAPHRGTDPAASHPSWPSGNLAGK